MDRGPWGLVGIQLLGEGAEAPRGCQEQVMETSSQGQRKETGSSISQVLHGLEGMGTWGPLVIISHSPLCLGLISAFAGTSGWESFIRMEGLRTWLKKLNWGPGVVVYVFSLSTLEVEKNRST